MSVIDVNGVAIAYEFHGDERDIIFLSMVDSPGRGPRPIRQREDARKVFNVAASRETCTFS